jgi:hypothetical protein
MDESIGRMDVFDVRVWENDGGFQHLEKLDDDSRRIKASANTATTAGHNIHMTASIAEFCHGRQAPMAISTQGPQVK